MRHCSTCATTTDESGRFCPDCGAALLDEGQPRTTASSSAERLIGMTIDGQFKIEAILGGGSFGTVYRGTQIGLERPVAVKVPTFEIASDPVMAKRFAREARAAARVHAPNVVATFAVGELPDGRPYLAMQLVDGQPLDKALVDGPLPASRALKIARAIAVALSETHAADVVHRDLKPTNIMWRDRNGDDRITLVDFGIAVCKPGNADATRLTANGLIGTPHYMSPEQAQGEVVDARADLYALGCLLFELVTGTTPYDGSGFEVLLAHLGRPAPLPSEKNPSVPACVDRLCAALMQKKPDDRPQNADEVVARIDDALAELADKPRARRSTKTPAAESSTSLPRKSRLGRNLLAGFVAVAGLAGAGFAVVQMREHPNAADAEPLVADDGQTKKLFSDNGEMLVQATVAEHIIAGKETRVRLEIKNKLGQPVVADELVVTVADTSGAAKGLAAKARSTKGRYGFRYTFPQAGHYTLRVFPPSVDSVFEIAVDVE